MATQGNATSATALNSLVGAMQSAKEKWDSSGASDAVNRVAQNIPQGTRDYISQTSSQLLDRKHLRSMTVCFGIGEERPFYVEKSPPLVAARMKHNLTFFYLNYLALTVILFCLTLLIHPLSIVAMALLGAAWVYMFRQTQQTGSVVVYGITISQNYASIGLGIISIFVLSHFLSGLVWSAIISSGFIVAAHAFLRDASMHQDGDDRMDMVGEFAGGNVGEDTAFLKGPSVSSNNPNFV